MYFRSKKLTLENISIVLEEYSRDIRDEVRSMLMDGIDLTDWIEICRDNPFRLKQIRMAALEGVSPAFFEIQEGETLYKLRKVIRDGFTGEELLPYVGTGLDKEQWSYIINWYQKGYLDSRLQLNRAPKSMWHYLDEGMKQGFPMYIFTTSNHRILFSGEEMRSILKIMVNGGSYKKYLDYEWNEDLLYIIADTSSEYWFKFYDKNIHNFLPLPVFQGIVRLAKKGFVASELLTNKDGSYKYSEFLSNVDDSFMSKEIDKFRDGHAIVEYLSDERNNI